MSGTSWPPREADAATAVRWPSKADPADRTVHHCRGSRSDGASAASITSSHGLRVATTTRTTSPGAACGATPGPASGESGRATTAQSPSRAPTREHYQRADSHTTVGDDPVSHADTHDLRRHQRTYPLTPAATHGTAGHVRPHARLLGATYNEPKRPAAVWTDALWRLPLRARSARCRARVRADIGDRHLVEPAGVRRRELGQHGRWENAPVHIGEGHEQGTQIVSLPPGLCESRLVADTYVMAADVASRHGPRPGGS